MQFARRAALTRSAFFDAAFSPAPHRARARQDLFEARAMPPVRMSYRAVGSSTGQYEFLGETNTSMPDAFVPYSDFGAGDIPFDADDYAALTAAGREFAHFPFLLHSDVI